MKDLSSDIQDLKDRISSMSVEYFDSQKGIDTARENKQKAKNDYQECLDRGDEKGMSACLKIIREANTAIGKIKSEQQEFSVKVGALRIVHEEILDSARAEQKGAEKHFEEAQKVRDAAKNQTRRVISLLASINNLKNVVPKP